jgi:hypothetical protein
MKPERNRDWRMPLVAVVIAIAISLTGCASPKTATSAPARAQRSAAKPQAGAASVDLLLVEALRQLIDHQDPAQAMVMADLAVKRAPQRIDAAWISLQICNTVEQCRPEALETQLRKLDPSNGAAWLGALARANARGDQAGADKILEAIARSERLDLYWNGMVANLGAALAERTRTTTPTNPTPLTGALNDVVTMLSRLAVPAFAPLAESCSARRVTDRLTSARCLLTSVALQHSDTFIAESIGLGIAQRLTAVGSAETAKVEQRIAVSRYQRDTAGEIIHAQVERERFSTQLLELMRKQRREQDVFIAVIRWSGRPVTPPPQS